ncbi:hypothetical protein [Caproiciproducens galactitolivorans]|uniref:Uncharacterized protein n=1 Tax=Caproiciproducens galactitolivorans TaxID=642589 RepID=A0ABT4BR00_9FIRM|nr:hypothetical protein [Caproiciproducens galactitolivorans]MCY1713329.1 hypothetical protein [Caproiciproducens galactitolivorans]
MNGYPKVFSGVIAAAGVLLIFLIRFVGKNDPVLSYLLSAVAAWMILNNIVWQAVGECRKYHRFAWNESKTLRSNCFWILGFTIFVCLLNFVAIQRGY